MMEEQQYLYFLQWIYGASVMIYLHNFFVSILLYKARQANGSNLLKIIINFTGTVTFICKFLLNATPSTVTMLGCQTLSYIANIDNLVYRVCLSTFLLWRLKQIGPTEYDKWIGTTLVIARTVGHIVYIVILRPSMTTYPSIWTYYKFFNICTFNVSNATFASQLAFLSVDVLIDIYVTVRLVTILRRANKNAAQISSNIERKTRRTLFTAVMYWNFVRMIISFGLNVIFAALTIQNRVGSASNPNSAAAQNFIQCFFFVLMSYAVTVDAEIVRVIEGKNQGNRKGSSSSGSKKSYPGTPNAHMPPSYKKYNSSTQSYNEAVYDENKFNVSMKRISFFEWANIVVGFRREDSAKQEFEKEELEEIIEGPSEAANLDPDRRNSDLKRNSDISGTSTVTSTISMSSHEHDTV